MEHFYEKIEGWFTFPDLYRNITKLIKDKAHLVEVGCWKGRSAAYLAVELINSNKSFIFDCVDTWEGSTEHVNQSAIINSTLYDEFISNMKPVEGYYNPIKKPSTLAATMYADESLDFVFIDAAHDYDNVKADIEAWLGKVKNGGILAGHDYAWCLDVSNAVNDVLGSNNILEQEGCWIFHK